MSAHDVSGEARDSRGRFASGGGSSASRRVAKSGRANSAKSGGAEPTNRLAVAKAIGRHALKSAALMGGLGGLTGGPIGAAAGAAGGLAGGVISGSVAAAYAHDANAKREAKKAALKARKEAKAAGETPPPMPKKTFWDSRTGAAVQFAGLAAASAASIAASIYVQHKVVDKFRRRSYGFSGSSGNDFHNNGAAHHEHRAKMNEQRDAANRAAASGPQKSAYEAAFARERARAEAMRAEKRQMNPTDRKIDALKRLANDPSATKAERELAASRAEVLRKRK